MKTKTLVVLIVLWLAAGALGVIGLLRWQGSPSDAHAAPLPAAAAVPDFSLTDQEGRPLALSDLRGRVWIGAFIFTRCSDICPAMAKTLASLQTAIADPDVRLVSFSVDPEHDTPAILKAYAHKMGADGGRWRLVTGPKADIERISRGMLLGLETSAKPEEITHSDRFVLVGRDGHVQGYYGALEASEIERLESDVARLSGPPIANEAAAP